MKIRNTGLVQPYCRAPVKVVQKDVLELTNGFHGLHNLLEPDMKTNY